MYVAMVLDAPSDRTAGEDATQITSKTCNEPIIDKNIQIRIVGPSIGIVMYRWTFHQLAPSIAAASVSSLGTLDSPARNRMSAKPVYFHVRMNSIVQITTGRLDSHPVIRPPRPTESSNVSVTLPRRSSSDHMMPTVTSAITYGTKTSSRKNDRPRNWRFNRSAMPSANGPWISSEPTRMSALLRNASMKMGSLNAPYGPK